MTVTLTTKCKTLWGNVTALFKRLGVNLSVLHLKKFEGRITVGMKRKRIGYTKEGLVSRMDRVYMRV